MLCCGWKAKTISRTFALQDSHAGTPRAFPMRGSSPNSRRVVSNEIQVDPDSDGQCGGNIVVGGVRGMWASAVGSDGRNQAQSEDEGGACLSRASKADERGWKSEDRGHYRAGWACEEHAGDRWAPVAGAVLQGRGEGMEV